MAKTIKKTEAEPMTPPAPVAPVTSGPPVRLASHSIADRDAAHAHLSELQKTHPRAECREIGGDVVEIWSGPVTLPEAPAA